MCPQPRATWFIFIDGKALKSRNDGPFLQIPPVSRDRNANLPRGKGNARVRSVPPVPGLEEAIFQDPAFAFVHPQGTWNKAAPVLFPREHLPLCNERQAFR